MSAEPINSIDENKDVYVCTWHSQSEVESTFSQKLADRVSLFVGSWDFLIIQTTLIVGWLVWNTLPGYPHFDPYPFVFLTLILSLQAAYAAPIIMMAQNRQGERDRTQANADYQTNITAKLEIEQLQVAIARIENEKLDRIISLMGGDIKKKSGQKKKRTPKDA